MYLKISSPKQCHTFCSGFNALNILKLRQNCCNFAEDIFKCIFLNENVRIFLKISLKFVPKVQISNIPALVQIMASRWPGDKPLSEPMMVSPLMHICVTRPQWVNCCTSPVSIPRVHSPLHSSIVASAHHLFVTREQSQQHIQTDQLLCHKIAFWYFNLSSWIVSLWFWKK